MQRLYINEANLPTSGVTVTHYYGNSGQTPNPTLAAAIPGFADAFDGLAYSVFSISGTAAISGWPRVEAVFRGRKIFDPRTGLTAWSENPSLFIHDLVTNSNFGPGLPITGVEACASFNDSIYFGEARARAGIMLSDGENLDSTLSALAAYADCLWHYDSDGIRLVPDMVVDVPAVVLTRGDIASESMRMSSAGTAQNPTVVTVTFLQESGGAAAWSQAVTKTALPGVNAGDIEEIESNIKFPGIRREIEAGRKGSLRLNRLRFPGQYSWQAFDAGVRFQHGDVVQLPDAWGLSSQLVRIMDITMNALGRYQINAEHYDPAMYADQILPDTPDSLVYEGFIFPISGDIPDGWAAFDAANGKFIKGADASTLGDTGGSAQVTNWAGSTEIADMHQDGGEPYPAHSTGGDSFETRIGGNTDSENTAHSHTVTVVDFTPDLHRRETRLVKKINGDANLLPSTCLAFGEDGVLSLLSNRTTIYAGRLLRAGPVSLNLGYPNIGVSTLTVVGAAGVLHRHGSDLVGRTSGGGPITTVYNHSTAGGSHVHTLVGALLSVRMARQQVAVYGANSSGGFAIRPGMFAFVDDPALLAALPPGWYLCDGTNGTPDMVDYYMELAGDGELTGPVGDNTIAITGQTSAVGHGHRGSAINTNNPAQSQAHLTSTHSHIMNMIKSWQPEWYAMAVIQFRPEGY